MTFRDTRGKAAADVEPKRRTSGPSGKVTEDQRHTVRVNLRLRPRVEAMLRELHEAQAAQDQGMGQEPATVAEIVESAVSVFRSLSPEQRNEIRVRLRKERLREQDRARKRAERAHNKR